MGDLTLQNFMDEVTGICEDNPNLTDAFLTLRVNEAYKHLTWPTVFEHPDLQLSADITLVAATASYALSAGTLARLIAITADGGVFIIMSDGRPHRLERRSFSRLMEDSALVTGATGLPHWYARRGRTLYLNIAPSAEYVGRPLRVHFWARPTLLSTPAQQTEIEPIWDTPITYLAASFAWARLGQPQRSDFYRDFAISMVQDYGGNLDLDATDPTDGFDLEDGNGIGYVEVA